VQTTLFKYLFYHNFTRLFDIGERRNCYTVNIDINEEVSIDMTWKLVHKKSYDIIENENGKNLSYHPNLGIQIIEKDGFAFKDLNATGNLDKFEDWRLPLTLRIHDFKTQFGLWQEKDCLYYPKGKIQIPVDVYDNLLFLYEHKLFHIEEEKEDMKFIKENYLLGVLLLMFDNDYGTGKEDYLLQLIVQSVQLGVLENVMYSIWEAVRNYLKTLSEKRNTALGEMSYIS